MSQPKWDPRRGHWTLRHLVKDVIISKGGEIPLEELLGYLREQGYHKESVRRSLHTLDVDVVDGLARLKG